MPYFTDVNTHLVVYRQYEINAEAVDGRIKLLPEVNSCFLVVHVPNRKFGYDVSVSDKGTAEYCFEKKEGVEKPNSGVYYSVVAENAWADYLENDKFYPEEIRKDSTVKEIVTVHTHIEPDLKHQKQPKQPKSKRRSNSLVRDTESSTYTYKSPNLR